MKRRFAWVLGFVMACAPAVAVGQHRGHSTGATTPNEPPVDEDLTKFAHAVELQASPRQVLHFGQFTQSTGAARKKAQAIVNHATADVLHGADPLIDLLDDLQWEGTRFFASFTQMQKSGLKPVTKKLGKTNDEIKRQAKALQGARAAANEGEILAVSAKLDETLAKFEGQQKALAREMGISDDESGE
ncbi:hypothetical protein [Candidatus Korobacter versatilis]|nr:hypothetical protein [Candidatus Koribacter versatilis]